MTINMSNSPQLLFYTRQIDKFKELLMILIVANTFALR